MLLVHGLLVLHLLGGRALLVALLGVAGKYVSTRLKCVVGVREGVNKYPWGGP